MEGAAPVAAATFPVPWGRMIRVARILTRLNIGGPAIQAATLSDRLRDRGFDTLLIHGRLADGEGDMSYLLRDRQVRTAYVPLLQRPVSPVADVRAVADILGQLIAFKPHLVHTHTAKAGTVGRAAAFAYNRLSRTKTQTLHTYHGHSLEGYFRHAGAFIAIERLLARATDRLVAISPRIETELRDRYRIGRPDQWTVVPLGFDLAPLVALDAPARAAARQALDLDPAAAVVTIVGRLTAIKQHELFLRVARAVHDRQPSAMFLIVGDGERRHEMETLAAGLGLDGHVRFCGWRQDLPTIYGATDVCVLTSRNEGTPVAVIEALAAGVPAVSTDVGGVRDVLSSPVLGATAPDGDVDALAAHVLRALAPDMRTPASIAARRASVTARYGFDRLVADIDDLYRSLLAR
jgi:glycosyltransferase involved in cell wall biosynthesis